MPNDICEFTEHVLVAGIRQRHVPKTLQLLSARETFADPDQREIQVIDLREGKASCRIETVGR